MLPVILLLGGGALLVMGGAKKKHRSSKSGGKGTGNGGNGGNIPLVVHGVKIDPIPEGGETGEPFGYCKPPPGSPVGTHAAFGEDGKTCIVFWKPETSGVCHAYIDQELDKLPKKERDDLCAKDECERDEFALDPETFCKWVSNPAREAFIKKIVLLMYPQIIPGSLPPPEPDSFGHVDAPYFIKMVWARVEGLFAHDYCGFNPVT